jgi:hypothetical protein
MVDKVPAIIFPSEDVRGAMLDAHNFTINDMVVAVLDARGVTEVDSLYCCHISDSNLTLEIALRNVLEDFGDGGTAASELAEWSTV